MLPFDIALSEIKTADRKGPPPPNDYSCHVPFKNLRLYAFKWTSSHFSKVMYFKFGLVENPTPPKLAVYSFHEDR